MTGIKTIFCVFAFAGLFLSASAADVALKEGDCWSYATRPGEEASYLVIQKIETRPALGEVIHISVVGLKIRRNSANTDLVVQVGHLPIAGPDLRASLEQKLERTAPKVDWLPGYLRWIDAKGGAFTQSVCECIEDIELGLNPARAASVKRVESQLRLDLREFLGSQDVDLAFTKVKSTMPTVLMIEAEPTPPSDAELRRLYADLLLLARGEEARLPPFVRFYADRLGSNRLLPQQKIIFDRLLRATFAATEKQLATPKPPTQ